MKCGPENPDIAKFCSECGEPIEIPQQKDRPQESTNPIIPITENKSFFDKNPDKEVMKQLLAAQKYGNNQAFDKMYQKLGFWGTFKELFIAYLPCPANTFQKIGMILSIPILIGVTILTLVMGIINRDTFQILISVVPTILTAYVWGGLAAHKPKRKKKKKK